MSFRFVVLLLVIHLFAAHILVMVVYNIVINPYDASIFTKIFPYQFLHNLYRRKPESALKSYFSFRLDIDTSEENVKKNDAGVQKLIRIADDHGVPITFSIATEYLPFFSEKTKEMIKNGEHAVITHGHSHEGYITEKEQEEELRRSKRILESEFQTEVKGLIAPKAKHDFETLKAAKKNSIEYISAGSLSYIRYWSFPYPFKKKDVWLLGGCVPSDYHLYERKRKSPEEALSLWKEAVEHRVRNQWFIQLEYHNFSTSEEKLKVLEELLRYVKEDTEAVPITLDEIVERSHT